MAYAVLSSRLARLPCLQPPLARLLATIAAPPAAPVTSAGPTAIVFLNMGGPGSQDEVEPFLNRLFTDRDLIPLGPLQGFLGPLIAKRRAPKIRTQYAAIGGGSPIRHWSELQAAAACRLLDGLSPATAPHRPYVAFRYAAPMTEDTYARLLADGIRRAVAFSQYPQYSCSTAGSSLIELWRCRHRLDPSPGPGAIHWSVIDRWPTHQLLVDALARNIQAKLAEYPAERRADAILLFSAHSLPMTVVNRGDPYPAEVAATVYAVMQRLNFSHQYRLCWQSQVGPQAWLGPQTADAVTSYQAAGRCDLVLIPVAFTSDHIETLFELDREVIAHAAHPDAVKRVDSLNDNPTFIRALADIAAAHLRQPVACSTQMSLRCPGCKSDRCLETKRFFAQQPSPAHPRLP